MLLSFNWLKNYISNFNTISPEEVAEKLKMSTVEVEGIKKQGELLDNVVVGKVLKCEKHPNADKLKVCQVDVGADIDLTPTLSLKGEGVRGETVQVVCGGSNVREGMFVALAKVGAKVKWHGEGELVELKLTKVRGVESQGMICASTEIGLGEMFPLKSEKEILDLTVVIPVKTGLPAGQAGIQVAVGLDSRRSLPRTAIRGGNDKENVIGQPIAHVLGLDDAILEIDNKSLSNRPDLWGHYGIAREVAVLLNKRLEDYKIIRLTVGKGVKISVKVEDTKLCPRYMTVAIEGVKVGESPEWLKQRLISVGLRPINNVVDITNYVMMDLGQPMHAFDKSKIKNQKSKLTIVIRRAVEGEEFVTLDGQKRVLDNSMLVIADDEKAIALAGVMGGKESGVDNDTQTIIFESANFDAATIRKTSTKLGLRTDSSARFEKSLDPNLCEIALKKAVELTLQLCPEAKVSSNIADESDFSLATGPLVFPVGIFGKKLGVAIPLATIIGILKKLGFEVKEKNEELAVKIPTWRATKDISIPEDIVEEVARIYGYAQVPSSMPVFNIQPSRISEELKLQRMSRNTLVQTLGYSEVYNYSFVRKEMIEQMGDSVAKYLELYNPVSSERPFVRRYLITNLLENVIKNIGFYQELRLVEIGKTYIAEESGQRVSAGSDKLLPRQDIWLCAVYAEKKNTNPFWEARRAAEVVFNSIGKELKLSVPEKKEPWRHPARVGEIRLNEKNVGAVYELHPLIINNLGLETRVSVMELNISALAEQGIGEKKYTALSLFPSVERDLAFLVKKDVAHSSIVEALLAVDPLLKTAELFDVYEGKNLGEGYKSMAYHLTFNANRTLLTEEVDKALAGAIKILKDKFGAEVRK